MPNKTATLTDPVKDLVAVIDERFNSGNAVPVERASIRDTEWQQLRAYLTGTFILLDNKPPLVG